MNRGRRSPFLSALFDPANLAMIGLVAAASLCAAWWLLPIGLALWLVMFLVVFNNPAMRFNNMIAGREPLAQRFQPLFDRLDRAQVSLYNTLAAAGPGASRSLKPVQDAVNGAVVKAYGLSRRMSTIENHVMLARSRQDPEAESAEFKEKVAATQDPVVKKDYDEARKTLEGQAAELKAMSGMLDRFDVQLSTLASVLEGCNTSAVRLQALKGAALRQEMGEVLKTIREQVDQLDDFEKRISGNKAA